MDNVKPWWTYPRIDNFGTIDPAGPYWKPDSNIQVPPGYPVIAASSGMVTSVQQTSWGQGVITISLDVPHNVLATHEFYEHLSSVTVANGQRVNQGDLIGHNNNGSPPLGFGFYSGDIFGSGSAWNQLQADLAPGGQGLLNPVSFIESLAGGNVTQTENGGASLDTGNPTANALLAWVQKIPGVSSIPLGSVGAIVVTVAILAAMGVLGVLVYQEVK